MSDIQPEPVDPNPNETPHVEEERAESAASEPGDLASPPGDSPIETD